MTQKSGSLSRRFSSQFEALPSFHGETGHVEVLFQGEETFLWGMICPIRIGGKALPQKLSKGRPTSVDEGQWDVSL